MTGKNHGPVNKLSHTDLWNLGKWLADLELTTEDTKTSLASAASERLWRNVTEANIDGVLKMIGKRLPTLRDPVPQEEAIQILAQCVKIIGEQLGIILPSKLEDLL